MQVERRTENRSDLTDWGGTQTERERARNEARRGGTVRQSTSKAEHSSGTAFDETELNSTWLDLDGCECAEDWGDESVDGGDDRLSSFQSSLSLYLSYSTLCLSLCLAAPRRFLIEMFCTIFLRITTCCLRATEEPPFHSSPPSLLLHCALPCPFWPSVQRATEQLAK